MFKRSNITIECTCFVSCTFSFGIAAAAANIQLIKSIGMCKHHAIATGEFTKTTKKKPIHRNKWSTTYRMKTNGCVRTNYWKKNRKHNRKNQRSERKQQQQKNTTWNQFYFTHFFFCIDMNIERNRIASINYSSCFFIISLHFFLFSLFLEVVYIILKKEKKFTSRYY